MIKIVVDARYDKDENRIIFGEPDIIRYVPEVELEKLKEENKKLKGVLEKIKEIVISI